MNKIIAGNKGVVITETHRNLSQQQKEEIARKLVRILVEVYLNRIDKAF